MKISSETLEVLKNFSNINSGIMIRSGNVVATVSQQKNILAEATVPDSFPIDFGIYDIHNFLSVISLYKDNAELEFENNDVLIVGLDGRSTIKYRFASENTLVVAPDKRPTLPSIDISFKLTNSDLEWIKKTAAVLGSPNIVVSSDGTNINLVAADLSDDNAHTMSLSIAEKNETGVPYRMVFKSENFKMSSGNYLVEIFSKGISTFKHEDRLLKYWITTEQTSKYGE